jgi:hypothetical protein
MLCGHSSSDPRLTRVAALRGSWQQSDSRLPQRPSTSPLWCELMSLHSAIMPCDLTEANGDVERISPSGRSDSKFPNAAERHPWESAPHAVREPRAPLASTCYAVRSPVTRPVSLWPAFKSAGLNPRLPNCPIGFLTAHLLTPAHIEAPYGSPRFTCGGNLRPSDRQKYFSHDGTPRRYRETVRPVAMLGRTCQTALYSSGNSGNGPRTTCWPSARASAIARSRSFEA